MKEATAMNAPAFNPNQHVEVYCDGKYRKAVIVKPAEWYHKGRCFGYEVSFYPKPETDPITGITPSMGGWKPENYIRKAKGE